MLVIHRVDIVRQVVVLEHSVLPIYPVSEDPSLRLRGKVFGIDADKAEEFLFRFLVVDVVIPILVLLSLVSLRLA